MSLNASKIHPSSIVEDGAQIGEGVSIGPFCHIGANVVLENGVTMDSHVSVTGWTTVGEGTRIFPHAVLGKEPQSTAYQGEETYLRIGKNNVIREGVTMHIGTGNARGETVVGDNCMFLAYSHVSHDSVIGNFVTFANNVMIGGHCEIGDRAILGGGAALHQFVRIGHHAFVGGMAGVESDVIPFGMVLGNRAYLGGLNIVGMKRSGMSREDIHALRHAYKDIFEGGESSLRENAQAVRDANAESAAVCDMADFILSDSKRKFSVPRAKPTAL